MFFINSIKDYLVSNKKCVFVYETNRKGIRMMNELAHIIISL